VGRKSRLKAQRAAEAAVQRKPETQLAELPIAEPTATAEPVTRALLDGAEDLRRRRGPTRRRTRPVGARVARVAVDDATWRAFRELCGTTPASIRLGQLVAAEVERANAAAPEAGALDALAAIRVHTDRLEQLIRRSPGGS
jgi:hypothetical protein